MNAAPSQVASPTGVAPIHPSAGPTAALPHPNESVRRKIARQLHGRGIEFGPGCHPLPLGPFVESILYCDAMDQATFAELFPETVEEIGGFPDPIGLRLDFDKEWFVELVGKESHDFIVASHVLEHLVNPLRFLEQCHLTLKEGGLLYVGQPDKRTMFDADRQRTPLADVIERYRGNVSTLEDERIVRYINEVHQPTPPFGPQSDEYRAQIEWHRQRSLHVNVWLIDDIVELFLYLGREMAFPFELIDGAIDDVEFSFVFRKSAEVEPLDRYPLVLARLWAESQRRSGEARLDRQERLCLALGERRRVHVVELQRVAVLAD